ncbi:MAG TPA: thiamine phosphate synthase [Candidatus Limnocylindrales bacterium]|nr:thiamine phosphate synthase [Candidatus Limnocylindrales bacterium]
MRGAALARRLRLIVITEAELAHPRSVEEVIAAALEAGAPAVQLRAKGATARELLELGRRLRRLTRDAGALLFVNDRVDVALALGADGAHVGPDDLPVAALRGAVPRGFLLGASADDPEVAARLVADGADYIGCGTVYATTTKPDAGKIIGLEGLDRVARAVDAPVVGIGGITPKRSAEVARTGAAGVAVVGAVMGAEDPGEAVRALLEPWAGREGRGRRW